MAVPERRLWIADPQAIEVVGEIRRPGRDE
jgi:hypothetical protein